MSKILQLLFGLLMLGMTACTAEEDALLTAPQDNLLQVPMLSRAALAPSATIVGLDASEKWKFSWNLTDPQPEVEDNYWTSSEASPSLTGVSTLACLVPAMDVSSHTVKVRPDADGVLQWGKVAVSDKASDDRFYINLDYKLATICVELDFNRSGIYVYHKTGGNFNILTGEFESLSGDSKYVSLTKTEEGKYMATFSVVPQKFTKNTRLLRYSTGSGGYTYTFKVDQDYDLKAGQTFHIHAYKSNKGWTRSYNTINVSGVTLNLKVLNLTVGQTGQLNATVSPSNADNKKITWESSDPNIVEIDDTGKVTALASGVVTIKVKTKDGGYEDTCQVIVPSHLGDWGEGGNGTGTLQPE